MTEPGDDGASSLLGIGAQASSALVGPVVLGIILDWQLGWTPYATLSGIGLGMFGMMSLLIRFIEAEPRMIRRIGIFPDWHRGGISQSSYVPMGFLESKCNPLQ